MYELLVLPGAKNSMGSGQYGQWSGQRAAGSSFFFQRSVIPSLNWSLRIKWEVVVRQPTRVSNRAPVESVSADWSDHVVMLAFSHCVSRCELLETKENSSSETDEARVSDLVRISSCLWYTPCNVRKTRKLNWEMGFSFTGTRFYGCRWHGALFLETFVRWKR